MTSPTKEHDRAIRIKRLAGYGAAAAAIGGTAQAKVIYHDIPDTTTSPYAPGTDDGFTIDLLNGDVIAGWQWGPPLGQVAFSPAPTNQNGARATAYTRHSGRDQPVEMAKASVRNQTALANIGAGVALAGPVFTGSGSTAGTSYPSLQGGRWGDSSFNDIGPFNTMEQSYGYGGAALKHPDAWQLGERGFIGIRMDLGGRADPGSASGSGSSYGSSPNDDIIYNYAWIELTLNADKSVTVHAFAYEDEPGAAIITGVVPEPSSLALLALGSAGVLARRRKS